MVRTHLLAKFEVRGGAIQGVRRVRRISDEGGGVMADSSGEVASLEGSIALRKFVQEAEPESFLTIRRTFSFSCCATAAMGV